MAATLHLSYDGLTDPLGSSQMLAYRVDMAEAGHRISLITLEKPERSAAERAAGGAVLAGRDRLAFHSPTPIGGRYCRR
jgi:hypothetical protein